VSRPRGPVLCACGHTKGWHKTAYGPPRCTATGCSCPAFDEALVTARTKFGNKRSTLPEWPGETFDSKAEADRARVLLLSQAATQVRNLRAHPRYDIVVNGEHVCWYTPDFEYDDVASGEHVVEDVKGAATTEGSRLRQRLLHAVYGFHVREVRTRERTRA
jgi:hypothetical protein